MHKVNVKVIFRKIRRVLRTLIGSDFFIKVDLKCQTQRFGSEYGGWDIISNKIGEKSIVYSFGVGEDASFDVALINKFGLTIDAFDPTPKSISWVNDQSFPVQFVMHEFGLADYDGEATFAPPENPDHVSHTILVNKKGKKPIFISVKKLSTIMDELDHNHIDILKMDIEGAEYQVIEDLIGSLIRPDQLLVEFHHRFKSIGAGETKKAINKLRIAGYRLFSVSESGEEYSFVYRP